jgi:hypothetical protein
VEAGTEELARERLDRRRLACELDLDQLAQHSVAQERLEHAALIVHVGHHGPDVGRVDPVGVSHRSDELGGAGVLRQA